MCGIITLVNKNSSKIDASTLTKSLFAGFRRAPNNTSYHFYKSTGLGFGRLSTIQTTLVALRFC